MRPRVGLRAIRPFWYEERPAGFTVGWAEEAGYRVDAAPKPWVEATLGVKSEEEAALTFVLAVLPLSLPLFDLEPFHGAALELGDGAALLVLGNSEAGKSTTAAALRAGGLRFLADDACAIDENGSLWPGPPLLSAWSFRETDLRFAVHNGKSVVAIEGHSAAPREARTAVVLRPEAGAALRIDTVRERDAMVAILGQVRSPWALPERRQRLQFETAAGLARHRVGLVSYDKASHPPDEVAEGIARWTREG